MKMVFLSQVRKFLLSTLLFLGFYVALSMNAKAESVEGLQKSAAEGSKVALYSLGVRFGNGDGVKQDLETANYLYLQSALKNYAPAKITWVGRCAKAWAQIKTCIKRFFGFGFRRCKAMLLLFKI